MPDLVGPAYFSLVPNLRMLARDCPFHEPTAKIIRVVAVNSMYPISRSAIKSWDNQKIQLIATNRGQYFQEILYVLKADVSQMGGLVAQAAHFGHIIRPALFG